MVLMLPFLTHFVTISSMARFTSVYPSSKYVREVWDYITVKQMIKILKNVLKI